MLLSTFTPSPDLLAAIVNGVDEGITVQDRDGRLVFANAVGARLVGFATPEELLAADVREVVGRFTIFDESGAPFPLRDLPARALFSGQPSREVTLRFHAAGDTVERWSVVRAMPIRDEKGEVVLAINLFRDVTAKRQSREAARLAEEWLATTLHSIGDAVIATDREGVVTFMNPVAEDLTGWRGHEAAGHRLREVFAIVDEGTRVPSESPVERVIRENTIVGLANHTVLVRRDGSEVAIDDSAAPIRDRSGALIGVVLVFRDVSHRRQGELRRAFLARATEELNASIDYHETLAKVARLAVPGMADWCAIDIVEDGEVRRLAVAHVDESKIALVSELQRRWPPDREDSAVFRMLRTGRSELMADIPDALLEQAAKDDEHLAMIRQLRLRSYLAVPLLRMGEPVGVITFAMAESNRRYDEDDLVHAEALADRAGVAVERARVFSEHREARALLEAARVEAEQASRSKDEFLAILGHELRNPLAPIRTAVEVMKLRGIAAIERERAVIERQVAHMVRLVDDLLDISRITRGVVVLAREPVELSDVVAQAVEMTRPLLDQRKTALEVGVPSGLVVSGDRVRLAQVVANLLSNAAKFTPEGGRVAISAVRDGERLQLRVRDDGIGIGADLLPRVFELFVQGSQPLDRSVGGLGLGLAITRRLVELHGGSVTAESEGLGKGSLFTVELPRLAEGAPAQERAAPELPAATPMRVLLVEDNADTRETLGEALELIGLEPHLAADGPEAIALAVKVLPSVAIVDIGLPQMDGYEIARRLRAISALDGTKLLALTGYGAQSDRDRSAAAGFDEHLVKPVSIDALHAAIARLFAPD